MRTAAIQHSTIHPPSAAAAVDELWRLVQSRDGIDAMHLWDTLAAIGRAGDDEDERTRLLIKTVRQALNAHFGEGVVRFRLGDDVRFTAEDQAQFPDGRGFHRLEERVEAVTDPRMLYRMLEELGARVRVPTTLVIGGSITLMLEALIVRKTSDVDVTDEVPASIREDPKLIDELEDLFGLRLTHFQSHYLPHGWVNRTKSIGQFGSIDARRVDPIDVLVAKLFSKRTRDFKDVLAAIDRVDRENITDRLRHTTAVLRATPGGLETATAHWRTLTGEPSLP